MIRCLGRGAAALGAMTAGWLLSPGLLAQGCAMCRTAVEGQNDPLARALSSSTLFFMAMPFVVAASVGGWLFLAFRRGGGPDGAEGETTDASAWSEPNQGD